MRTPYRTFLLTLGFTSLWLLVLTVNMYAETPTDEELQELERQIEQEEAKQIEAKKRVEAEAKRKAEEERQHKEEAARQAEQKRLTEQEEHQKKEEELRQLKEQEKVKADEMLAARLAGTWDPKPGSFPDCSQPIPNGPRLQIEVSGTKISGYSLGWVSGTSADPCNVSLHWPEFRLQLEGTINAGRLVGTFYNSPTDTVPINYKIEMTDDGISFGTIYSDGTGTWYIKK